MCIKLIHLLAGAVCATLLFCSRAEAAPPPNVIFILADDQGWNDIGYHNPELRTPNLDQLAREGVELDAHYAQPECTPTRVALMTGRYPSRFGPHCLTASNESSYPIGTPTLASMFKSQGYATALCGKWHMGSKPEWGPNHYGFDYSYGSLAGAVGMYDHRYRLGTPFEKTWHRNLEFIEEEGNAIDLVTNEALTWISTYKDAPFFLYLPYHAVHTPIVPKEEWLALNAHIEDPDRRSYAAVLSHLDDSIGKIIRSLNENNLRKNTLIIYSSDNGAQVNHSGNAYPAPDPALKNFSSNAPLRGRKSQAYEGGIRVPAFLNWPGRLAPGKFSTPMHMVDWLPTLAHLSGAKETPDKLDGVNLWPLIAGENATPPDRVIYEIWGAQRQWEALHHGDWKIVRNRPKPDAKPAWQLYNLANDPKETTNLAATHPERVAELGTRFAEQESLDAISRQPKR